MQSPNFSIKRLSLYLNNFFRKRSEGVEKQIFLFGIIFFFNYPLYYFIWRYAAQQGYESLTLRIIASIICLPLIFVRHWPKKIANFLPAYWHFAVTFCLPFFFTFMTIMNQGSVAWLLNLILALLLIFILLDFIGLCFSVLIGSGAAFLCFMHLSPIGLSFNPGSINLAGTLATFIAALVVGGVFARNREIIIAGKMRRRSEAANKAKTEFIANMSHDIRTPITGIVGLVQDLLNRAEEAKDYLNNSAVAISHDRSNEVLKDLVNLIERDGGLLLGATDELLQLCNEILETINLESGKTSAKAESFDIRELIQQNVELFNPAAKNKKLCLSSNVEDDVPLYLNGLRKFLYRCVVNLVSNALKFTEFGEVRVAVSVKKKYNNSIILRIIVADSGTGIPKDKFDVIFENFSRLTPSFEGIYKGSGLGLYTVKQYVKAMHGEIHVDSELGEGTQFVLDIPFSISDHSSYTRESIRQIPKKVETTIASTVDSNLEKSQLDGNAGKILIVEDNLLAAMAVKTVLKPFNCHIEIADSGAKAVAMAEENHYDLILMDIGLPDFSGIEATKRIRSINDLEKSRVSIVALTGHANNSEMRQEAIDAGMQEVISKPAQPLVLESILKEYVFKVGATEQLPHENTSLKKDNLTALAVIDWDACVRMCNGDPKFAREMLDMLHNDLEKFKSVLAESYAKCDTKTLRSELHRIRGGVCYLKVPQLEHALKEFHQIVKAEPQDKQSLEASYTALQDSINIFLDTWESGGF